MLQNIWYKPYHWIAQQVPKVTLRNRKPLSEYEKKRLAELLASGYYIIVTSHDYHLSSQVVRLMSWIKSGKRARFSHVLMNVDFLDDPKEIHEFKFMEATVKGVHYSKFDEVFDCTDFALLSPKNVKNEHLTEILDNLVEQEGKEYDDLFQIADETKMSCVELIRYALKSDQAYEMVFPKLEHIVKTTGNLIPEDFYTCGDFEVVYQRHFPK